MKTTTKHLKQFGFKSAARNQSFGWVDCLTILGIFGIFAALIVFVTEQIKTL